MVKQCAPNKFIFDFLCGFLIFKESSYYSVHRWSIQTWHPRVRTVPYIRNGSLTFKNNFCTQICQHGLGENGINQQNPTMYQKRKEIQGSRKASRASWPMFQSSIQGEWERGWWGKRGRRRGKTATGGSECSTMRVRESERGRERLVRESHTSYFVSDSEILRWVRLGILIFQRCSVSDRKVMEEGVLIF